MYDDNYKTLIKATEDDSKKWTATPRSWNGGISVIYKALLPKANYRFHEIAVKVPILFTELEQIILTCI